MVEGEIHRAHNEDGLGREYVRKLCKEVVADTEGLDIIHPAENAVLIHREGRKFVVVQIELNRAYLGTERSRNSLYTVIGKVEKPDFLHTGNGLTVKSLHISLVQVDNLNQLCSRAFGDKVYNLLRLAVEHLRIGAHIEDLKSRKASEHLRTGLHLRAVVNLKLKQGLQRGHLLRKSFDFAIGNVKPFELFEFAYFGRKASQSVAHFARNHIHRSDRILHSQNLRFGITVVESNLRDAD